MSAEVTPVAGWTDDVARVAERMRAVDRVEIWELNRRTPEQALRKAIGISQDAYVGSWDGEPVAVFGCHTVAVGAVGVPWLLGTDELNKHPRAFLRTGRRYVEHLRTKHAQLQNVVHVGNRPSVVFLSTLGFAIHDPYETDTGAIARAFTMEGLAHV